MKGYKSLRVYNEAIEASMEIFELSKSFPIDEKYSLTGQILRSSRSIGTNIAEAYRKRQYPKHFSSKISDADAECSETIVWLEFAFNCGYLNMDKFNTLVNLYHEIGKKLHVMINHPTRFLPRT